jgi:glycosyltransferase involved in cell wall biosynthesis
MEKISVIIITKEEEENISACLTSVKWADEIIVVDSESTDRTVEISKQFTNKIFIKKWDGYVPQKNYAMSLARNDWVLSIDADERITPELKEEIESIAINKFDGYRIRRRNFILKKEVTSCGWGNDYQLKLFRKSKANLTDRLVHERFVVEGEIDDLKNPMLHFTFPSFPNYISKINHYTSLRAEELFKKKKKTNGWGIFTRTISAFLRFYITKMGFKDGVHGLIISSFHALSKMLTYIKLWEMQNKQ